MTLPGFWIKIAALFLLRSRRSTAVLVLMVLSAVSTLVFLSALAEGINETMIKNAVNLYSGHIQCHDLPNTIDVDNLHFKGVEGILKRISCQGFLFAGDKAETITLVAIHPVIEKKYTALWKKVIQGQYLADHDKFKILIGQSTASRLNIKPGQSLQFASDIKTPGKTFTVSGIYRTGLEQFDGNMIFCSMDALPVRTSSWSAAVFLEKSEYMDTILNKYNVIYPGKFSSWSQRMPDLKQLIDMNYISMSIVMIIVFGVVSLGVACAQIIFILKNLKEYGIMKAMGVTSFETGELIFAEVILLNTVASFLGVLVGIIAVLLVKNTGLDITSFTSHNQYFAVSGIIYPELTEYALCLPPLLAMVFCVTASLWPVMIIIREKAADILRAI